MQIICTTTFLDGRDRFEQDDKRTVDDERAARFIANGWAHEAGTEPPPVPVPVLATATDITAHNATHKTTGS